MVSTVGRFLYTKNLGLLLDEHWEYLFTQNTWDYFMLRTVRRFIYTKYWGILYVEHCWKIYLQTILGITLCWTLWEDFFKQNTEECFKLNTVGRSIYTKYWGKLYGEHCGKIYLHKILGNTLCWALRECVFTQNTGNYFMLNTVGKCIYTKYRGILYVEHYGKIYLKKNTGDYFMLNTVGRLFTQNIW